MKNDAIILQQIYSMGTYAPLMALTFPRHIEYAKRHAMDYEFIQGDVIPEWDTKMGGWAKLAVMLSALQRGYEYVIWVDADSVIVDMTADLRDGCPDGIGFVVHRSPGEHYNVGNIYMRNSKRVQAFIAEWGSWYPGPEGWREQAVLNLLARTNDIVKPIDAKWNSCRAGNSRVDNPVVEGFHGEGPAENRYKLMQKYIKALK